MSFLSSFSRKKSLDLSKRSPAVRSLIERTLAYLRNRATDNPDAEIRPAMLAQAIGENEVVALTALSMLEDAGITKAHIGLYCDATMQYIGQAEPGEPIPQELPCDACAGDVHALDSGAMKREIFFTFDVKALSELKKAA